MDPKNRTVINLFDNHCFEKFRGVDEATGAPQVLWTVDGVEVTEKEWMQRQEEALARDLAGLHLNEKSPKNE